MRKAHQTWKSKLGQTAQQREAGMESSVAVLVSHGRVWDNERKVFLDKLFNSGIPTVSYGKWRQTPREKWPLAAQQMGELPTWDSSHKLKGLHVLSVALESMWLEDYVTEKLWKSIAAGSIPIYNNVPANLKMLPNPEGMVLVPPPSDEAGMAAALAEIEYLLNNQTARQEKWEKLNFTQSLIFQQCERIGAAGGWGICAACQAVLCTPTLTLTTGVAELV
eukprot:TRINITY_DN65412_c0_g1_i1.p1 TRINITY_DN65412_c0_g1~~TRINITY_DN65412_c0_g1_i1.p1  ORF type:complete len:221 (-),score=39.96 TRINITY_DN65412_c0_g1_i1:65-727(-)